MLAPTHLPIVSPSTLAFKEMENVGNFIASLSNFGVRPEDLFQTTDL